MIVDYSFSRLTTRMIVHDSFSVSCFGNRRPDNGQKTCPALFRREKFILLRVCLTGRHLAFAFFTRKEVGTRCSRDFACVTAGELSSTIMNFFGRFTIETIVGDS